MRLMQDTYQDSKAVVRHAMRLADRFEGGIISRISIFMFAVMMDRPADVSIRSLDYDVFR